MKILIKITSVLLTLTTFILSLPMTAFAAPKRRYVSEVTTCAAKSFDDAKSILEKDGYTIVDDSKLNGTDAPGVYLGYKTTFDPDEAITDLAVMDMRGDFSEARYQEMLEENKKKVSAHINELLVTIAAFQFNYQNGSAAARIAYENLNNYIEDKVGDLGPMGDYLLHYDFSEASARKLTDVFMKGESGIIQNIEKLLVMGTEDGSTSFTERINAVDYDAIEEEYIDEYGSYDIAEREMSRAFDETAIAILSGWEGFRQRLDLTKNEYVIFKSDGSLEFNEDNVPQRVLTDEDREGLTDEELETLEAVNSEMNLASYRNALSDFILFASIRSTEYGDTSLYDYLNRPADEVELWELYPLVYAMNVSQRAHAIHFGIGDLLEIVFAGASPDAPEDLSRVYKADEPVSVYSGVDLSIYDEGVAFTEQAQNYEALTGDSWFNAVMNDAAGQKDYIIAVAVTSSVAIAAFAIGCLSYLAQGGTKARIGFATATKKMLYGGDVKIRAMMQEIDNFATPRKVLRRRVNNQLALLNRTYLAEQLVCGVMFLVFVIALFMDIYMIFKLIAAEKAVESEVPHHLVTAEDTRDGSTYIYYAAAKDRSGKAADINNDNTDDSVGWLVLYSTKDSKAGSPIEAGSLRVQHGSNTVPKDCSGVHLFGDSSAANVTAKVYTGKSDSVNGTYIFFARDVNAYAASAFSTGSIALAGAGGLVLGLLLGLIPTLAARKKKEEETAAA